jgi:dienelactone hydrolase
MNPGPYNVESILEADGLRDGPDYFGATLYYPTDAAPPYPGIAIVPGYFAAQSSIQAWGPFYASHGIVAITIGTNEPDDLPDERAVALLDAVETIRYEHSRVGSPLFGMIDTTRFAVSGWSMGGGGSQLAASLDTNLKAVVALCPWLQTGTLTSSDLDHPVPVLIFSGELDGVAPPSAHANVHYDYTPETTDKLLFEIDNGNHSVANSPTGGSGDVGRIALSWLKQFLINDTCYCPLIPDAPNTASMYETTVECNAPPTAVAEVQSLYKPVTLYPNPARSHIFMNEDFDLHGQYAIYTALGEQIESGTISNGGSLKIDISHLPANLYILRLMTGAYKFFKID